MRIQPPPFLLPALALTTILVGSGLLFSQETLPGSGQLIVDRDPGVPSRTAPESEWISYIASQLTGADTEHQMFECSRADIAIKEVHLGEHHGLLYSVWEVERASKWKEAVGQARLYQKLTGAPLAGIYLITLDNEKDKLFLLRCRLACEGILEVHTVDEHGIIR